MKSINGFIDFYVGDIQKTLYVTNLIFLEKTEHNEDKIINQIFTEDCVFIVIECEIKNSRLKGLIHDINVYDENNNLIAYAYNLQESYHLSYNMTRIVNKQ